MISSYNIVNDISQIVSGLGELTSYQLQYMSNEDYQAYINNITDWQELTNLWTQLKLLHKNATYTYNTISRQIEQMGSSAPEPLIKEGSKQAAFANSAMEKIELTLDKLDSAIRSTAGAWVQSSKSYGATLSNIYRLGYLLNEAGIKKNNSAYTQYLSEYESAVNDFNNNILPDLFQRGYETISTAAERIVEETVNEAVQQTELSEEEIADFQKIQSDFSQALEERQQAEAEAAKLAAEVAERQRQAEADVAEAERQWQQAEAEAAKLAAEVAERQRQAEADVAEAERQRQQAEAEVAQKAAEAQQLDELTAEELEKLNKLKDDLKREKEKKQQSDSDDTTTEKAEKIKKYVRYGLVAVLLLLLFSDDDEDNKKKNLIKKNN